MTNEPQRTSAGRLPVYLLTTSSMIVLKVVRALARFYLGECIGM